MTRKAATLLFLIVSLALASAFSQIKPRLSSGKAAHYDKSTETTLRGTVEGVTYPTKNRWAAAHLTLKSDQGVFEVHLGPSAYISSQHFSFAKDDTIEVLGSKVEVGGRNALLARQITKDGKVLKLRDEQGFPVFARRERQSSHSVSE